MVRGQQRLRVKPATVFVYIVLILGIVPMLFPFVWMVLTSLKPFQEVFSLNLLPSNPTLANYGQLFSRTLFPRWFLNSTIVAAITVASVLFFDSLVGYTLAKLPFPGKNVIFVLILSTMFVPTEMLVLPWYQMSAQYGWLDTYWGILFPGIMTAFGVFLMRQAFATLPDELLDAGRIDGLSEFGIFLRIALPLVKPSLAALAILTFIGNWNAYLWPLIATETRQMYTLPVGISLFSGEVGAQWNLITAGSAVAVIPMMIVFIIFQRQILEGVVRSGLK
ncbi:MAG: carbohydrate ABC transporter permease [Limnochordales bacterium]|nr:sugar ABC transporter permease [Bacillota bacterium]REJ34028.1 MAG: sugar ABC transporter permease [Bacillota bacterium]